MYNSGLVSKRKRLMEFVTKIESCTDHAAFLILGCGVVLVKSDRALAAVKARGFKKIRTIFGRNVGFSIFGYEV